MDITSGRLDEAEAEAEAYLALCFGSASHEKPSAVIFRLIGDCAGWDVWVSLDLEAEVGAGLRILSE